MTNPAPDGSESWIDAIYDAVVSDVQQSGYFAMVNEQEITSLPSARLTAAVWLQSIGTLPRGNALNSTSGRLVFNIRVYGVPSQTANDVIDRDMTRAVSNLIRRYHDDFDFGLTQSVRNVDCLGTYGIGVSATAGWVRTEDQQWIRAITLTLPIIVNDVWPQTT